MNIELLEQAVAYTFSGDVYPDGKKTRTLKNVAKDAKAESLVKIGKALSELQRDDGLVAITLIQKNDIAIEPAD